MDTKDLLISVGELHSAMEEARIHAITMALVKKMRENMAMLPAFPFNDDKERQVSIERALIAYEMGIKDGINEWLKSIKDRVQPKTTEWSEEDEHRVNDTIYFLDSAKKHYASTVEIDACIDWLKSLKQRIGE